MRAATLVLAGLLAGAAGGSAAYAGIEARFHHVHFRAEDPAAAMNEVVRRGGGTRVILQGLGVGVRIVDEYILFDRAGADAAPAAGVPAPPAHYAAAARWLRAHGFDVAPSDLRSTRLAALLPEARVDHVAFAVADLPQAIASLQRAGVEAVRRTADSAWFAVDGGMALEITRDGDRPDAFWCPMHPDVRSSSPARCPVCSMDLVAIPPPAFGHYRFDVSQVPRANGTGAAALHIEIGHPETREPVTAFNEIHERLLHLFIVRRDLGYFAHVHPEMSGHRFEVPVDLDPGAYVLIADFVPAGGAPQLVQRAIVTAGYSASPFASAALTPDLADKTVGGVRISLTADVKAQREGVLRFTLHDAAGGSPVSDLEPYLGASGHLLIVNADVTEAIHTHPEGKTTHGPEVVFSPVLPAPGLYKMWVQVQRKGSVLTAPFTIVAR